MIDCVTTWQCPAVWLFLEMKSEKRNWWKKRSSTAAAWWMPSYQRQHVLCKRNSIYRNREVWEVLYCCQSHALRILTLALQVCTYCLSDLNLSALWINEIMKMYCSTNVGLEFEGDICDVTSPVILSGCIVQTGTMHNNWFFLKTKSALDRVKWRIPPKRLNQTDSIRCWQSSTFQFTKSMLTLRPNSWEIRLVW